MNEHPADRPNSAIAALSGFAFILLAVVGNELAGGGAPDKPASFLRWLDSHRAELYTGLVLELVGLLLALVFAAYVMSLVARYSGDWLVRLGVGSVAAAVAIKIASLAPVLAGVELDRNYLSDDIAAVLVGMNDASFALFTAPLAAFMLAVGLASRGSGTLPRWLSYAALLISPLLVLNAVVGYSTENVGGFLLFMLWTVVASLLLTVRARRSSHGAA